MSFESEEKLKRFLKSVLLTPDGEGAVLRTLSELTVVDRVVVLMELARASSLKYSHWEQKLRDFTCKK